jgi:hypothetical protein
LGKCLNRCKCSENSRISVQALLSGYGNQNGSLNQILRNDRHNCHELDSVGGNDQLNFKTVAADHLAFIAWDSSWLLIQGDEGGKACEEPTEHITPPPFFILL